MITIVGQPNVFERGNPIGGMRPAAPRAARQGVRSVSVLILPLSPPSAQLSPTKPLNHLGLDSLMAIELRNQIKTDLAFEVPAVKFLEGTTIADLASDLARTGNGPAANHGGNDSGGSDWGASEVGIPDLTITPDRAGQLLSRVGELSNEEVEALLAAVAERPE